MPGTGAAPVLPWSAATRISTVTAGDPAAETAVPITLSSVRRAARDTSGGRSLAAAPSIVAQKSAVVEECGVVGGMPHCKGMGLTADIGLGAPVAGFRGGRRV